MARPGPYLITRVYERHCRKGGMEERAMEHCRSLTILEPRALCPVFMFNNQVFDVSRATSRQSVSCLECNRPLFSLCSSRSPFFSSLSHLHVASSALAQSLTSTKSKSRRRLRMAGMWGQVLMRRWEERCYQMRDMAR